MRQLRRWSVAGVVLVMLAAALAPAPASAAPYPPELGVLLFPQANYQGTPRRFTLQKGVLHKSFALFDERYPKRSRFGSVRIGRRVGLLMQDGPWGGLRSPADQAEILTRLKDVPDLGSWKSRSLRHIVVFVAYVDGRRRRGQLELARDHPDGAEFGRYRAAHVVGGSNPRLPEVFVTSDPRSLFDGGFSPERERLREGGLGSPYLWKSDFHWLRVYGAKTVVTIKADGNHRWDFHTHGKPYAEYDLHKFMRMKAVLSIRVQPRKLSIVPSEVGLLDAKGAARDYWVYRSGHFIKTTGNTWEVYAQGRKVFSLQETGRTKELVELRSTTHALRIRLKNDASWVLDPRRGASKWQKQYTGGWRDRPREAIAKPGLAPAVPTNPAALMRQVPKVIGLTRTAADKTIRAAGLVPTFQRLAGAAGGSTEVVAQSPTGGAALTAGSRVVVRYRDMPGTREPSSPGPAATGPAARTYWTYNGGHFIKMPNGTWDVYAGSRKVFTLKEQGRTADFVLLHSPAHKLRVRLHASASWVLDPNRGAKNWTKQYDGQWRTHPKGR